MPKYMPSSDWKRVRIDWKDVLIFLSYVLIFTPIALWAGFAH